MLLVTVTLVTWTLGEAARNSRVVRTRQGALQGIMLVPDSPILGPVEAYLGVPYAAPPVGRLRFMPPGSPRSWDQVRRVTEFGSVCPQIIPDLSNENEALRFMTVGRMNYLKKLFLYLQRDQSEDCLYLNIYAPEMQSSNAPVRMPVIVFIHGESYEWNSGNPYDGSVLASYGQVIVITINYRLGLLGFLKTEENNQIGNYGLLDILAALQWIQVRPYFAISSMFLCYSCGTVKFNMCVSSLHGALPVCRNRKMRGGEGRKSVGLQIVKKRRGNLHVGYTCVTGTRFLPQPKDIVLEVSRMALQI